MSNSTPMKLESYICGKWQAGRAEGKPVLDAYTGETVALIDSTGIDFQAAIDYGRAHGKSLRAMTMHQRASLLKAIGLALLEVKEELYELSYRTGATRADSWGDIEGGISTFLSYASKARRELPNLPVVIEGSAESLSRDGSFLAEHILRPLEGVAIHINAFNFPCWGMLEKLAPTWLAGLPAIIKPASQTAYLTELLVRKMLDTGLVPEGALQLICGSSGNLLDLVESQDVVTFTGSASTGRMLRQTPAIINNSVRFTMEADSLNASVLGLDVTPEMPEFDLFVTEVMREMTLKAGQKCTAIRRVIVPRAQVKAVSTALSAALETRIPGDPREKETKLGALASLEQYQEVREKLAELMTEAEVVYGDPNQETSIAAIFKPVLLYCDQPLQANKVHEVEAFGPVSTIMAYDSLDDAIALVKKGGGSLVSSVFTNDGEVSNKLVLGMANFNGRILVSNRDSAKSSTGHGNPMPGVIHGGPGRAGGGEELGGVRAIKHYMQRTGVQAPPSLLQAITGRWYDGAPVRNDKHPFRRSLETLRVGDQVITDTRTITIEDIEHFAHFTGDTFYAHMDEVAAKANPFFDDRVAHGYLIASFVAGLFVEPNVGPVLANYGVDNLRFLTPVYAGDTLAVRLTCREISPRINSDYGEVRWDCFVTNQKGDKITQYDVLTMVANKF